MKARVKATGEIVEVYFYGKEGYDYVCNDKEEIYERGELEILDDPDYWTRLEHQYAGQFMQAMISSSNYIDVSEEAMADASLRIAHALVEKVRYEENPKELEGLKKELEALKIEKTILENKIKLLTEERK